MLYFTETIQYLSAKGDDYDLKACGVRFKHDEFRRNDRSPLDGTSI